MTARFQSHARPFTKRHIKNLERLATYLESLPKNYKDFDMSAFVGDIYSDSEDGRYICTANNSPEMEHYGRYNGSFKQLGCGAVACAVGHGPSAGLFVEPKHFRSTYHSAGYQAIEWGSYSADLFTGANMETTAENDYQVDYDTRFEWMFGGDWSSADNHHWGAAARIRWMIAHNGDLPKAFIKAVFTPAKSQRRIYARYRIKAVKPLPEGFYTKSMLATFARGEREAKRKFTLAD